MLLLNNFKMYILLLIVTTCLGAALVKAVPPELAQTCSSPACKQTAELFLSNLNTSVNPCDDFYEFACGGMKQKIPDDKFMIEPFSKLNSKMLRELKELLDKYNWKTEMKMAHSSKAVSYAAFVYQKCVQLGTESSVEGLKQLKELVQNILGQWSIGQKLTEKKEKSWNELMVTSFAISPIFMFTNFPDPKNETRNMIYLGPSKLGLGDNQLKNLTANAYIITAYKDYIRNASKLFCKSKNCKTLEEDITNMVNFESELAQSKMPTEDLRDPAKTGQIMTVKELSEKTHFNWITEYFTPIWKQLSLPPLLTESEHIQVSDLNFFIKAVALLKKTSPKTIANLIGWRIVTKYGPTTSEELRHFEFKCHQVIAGLKKQSERWETCFDQANGELGFFELSMAISRIFVEKYFTVKEKETAVNLVDSIQQSYHQLIKENTWLDETTRNNSLLKLDHYIKNVAYPEWLLNNTQLDALHALNNSTFVNELFSEKNYLISFLKFNLNVVKDDFVHFKTRSYNTNRWFLSPATINAVYYSNQNSITIPAGFLKFPFFEAERPASINYGSSGVVIAHEFTHGLDDRGRKFDDKGNLHDWWTKEAVRRFNNRSECFVKQYESEVEPISKIHLNAINGLGENIADNGGVHVSYRAFKTHSTSHPSPRLADMPKYSSEQLFFISWANTWCNLVRPEVIPLLIQYDPHPPGQYRVNIPLRNSPDFTKAFACSAGSKMNPKNKCSIW